MADAFSLASLGAAFGAGLLSVLSPCVLPLLPAYLSLVSGLSLEEMRLGGEAARVRRRVLQGCVGFCLGFSSVFVALGASATLLGRWLRSFRLEAFGLELGIAQLAGLLIIGMGLHVTGWVRIPALYRERRLEAAAETRNWIGTFLVGAAFAFGWTPCVGPILGGILTLAGARDTLGEGMFLLAVYSSGLAVPFLAAGFSVETFLGQFRRLRPHFGRIELASGLLLIAIGVLVTTDRLTLLNGYFGFLNDWLFAAEQALL